jgi:peptide/nickel transport system permease protein
MGLRGYIAKRIVYMVILIFAIITVDFLIFAMLPGNPLEAYVAKLQKLDEERYNALKAHFGLDKPIHEQYLINMRNLLTFNFGISFKTGAPVSETIFSKKMPNTLLLLGISTIFSIIVGMLLGVIAAYKRGGTLDTSMVTFSLVMYSVPIFFIGWLIIFLFAVQLGWFPAGLTAPPSWGRAPPTNLLEIIVGRLSHIVLPAFTLFLFSFGGWILLTRACVLETITEDYVVTARAKGLKERTVLYKHVLKNASLPLVTNVALSFASVVSGATITETLFSYDGIGLLTFSSIINNDLPILYALFYILGLCIVFANFIADLLYGVLDPRIRYG